MQLQDKTGIACDQCGTTYSTDFLYYSFDFRKVSVQENRRPPLNMIHGLRVTSSLDICVQCFEQIKQKIIENYSKFMRSDVRNRGKQQVGVICEFTGENMKGTFDYYHCNVIKVNIKMSDQPNICIKCNKQMCDNKPCDKCGGIDFIKPAETQIDDRYVEVNCSNIEYNNMVNKSKLIYETASVWTTRS